MLLVQRGIAPRPLLQAVFPELKRPGRSPEGFKFDEAGELLGCLATSGHRQ